MQKSRKRHVRKEPRKLPDWISWEMVNGKREMRVIGLPVKMAKQPIPAFDLSERDIDKAGRTKDPTACAMANCLRRVQHADFAAVLKNVMFLHRPGAKHVDRYPTTQAIRENVVIPNDSGGRVQAGRFSGIRTFGALTQAKYESGGRQGGKSKGGRDRGSKDRTPGKSRMSPIVLRGIRQLSLRDLKAV